MRGASVLPLSPGVPGEGVSVTGRGPQDPASTGVKPVLLSAGPQANPAFQEHDPQRGNEQTLAPVP